MAVTRFNEEWRGREGEITEDGGRYIRVFDVKTDSAADGAVVVKSHPSCPQFGSTHPDDPFAWCDSVLAAQRDSRIDWSVTATYSTGQQKDTNPLNEPAKITWDQEEFQRPLIFDANGDPVVNSAFCPYDPPYMVDDSRQIATVVKNVASVPAWVLNYRNVVNSDVFTLDGISIAVGYAKIKGIKISEKKRLNNIDFRTLTIPINLNEDGWLVSLQDMGYYEIKTIDSYDTKVPIQVRGKTVTVPWPLDGSGSAIPEDQVNLAAIVNRTHQAYATAAFSTLPLT